MKRVKAVISHPLSRELWRFGVTGVVSAIVDIGGLVFLKEVLGVHYLIASAISFLFALSVNYGMSVMWVFEKRSMSSKAAKEIFIFSALSALGIGLNQFLMWFLTDEVQLYYLHSKLIAIIVCAVYNYVSKKVILFK